MKNFWTEFKTNENDTRTKTLVVAAITFATISVAILTIINLAQTV